MKIVESILDDADWRAKSWYLERSAPEEWGRSQPREIIVQYQSPPPPSPPPVVQVSEDVHWLKEPVPLDLARFSNGAEE